jgi:hypothetical protein
MMERVSRPSVINKIRALLARASEESNDNPHERLNAIKHAHRLMDEHALSMLEITEEELESVGKSLVQVGILNWKRGVVSLIASLYGCAVCWPTRRGSKHHGKVYVYGREDNRITVETISAYVIGSIEGEWLKVRRQQGVTEGDKRSFCVGALYGVRDTVKALKAARVSNAASSGRDLALLDKYQEWEQEAREAMKVTRVTSSPNAVRNQRLAAQGRELGRRVRLEPRLGNGD